MNNPNAPDGMPKLLCCPLCRSPATFYPGKCIDSPDLAGCDECEIYTEVVRWNTRADKVDQLYQVIADLAAAKLHRTDPSARLALDFACKKHAAIIAVANERVKG